MSSATIPARDMAKARTSDSPPPAINTYALVNTTAETTPRARDGNVRGHTEGPTRQEAQRSDDTDMQAGNDQQMHGAGTSIEIDPVPRDRALVSERQCCENATVHQGQPGECVPQFLPNRAKGMNSAHASGSFDPAAMYDVAGCRQLVAHEPGLGIESVGVSASPGRLQAHAERPAFVAA